MARQVCTGAVALAVLVCVGCTSVQKGVAVGGGAGGAYGATVGHLTSLGTSQGAILGLGLGAAAGALAAESYYPSDDAELVAAREDIKGLTANFDAGKAQTQELRSALETERQQREALLEAYERLRASLQDESVPTNLGSGVQVSEQPGGGLKITLLSEVMFSSGKAKLTSAGKSILSKTAETIKQEFPDATVEIRGHTDNVPIRYSDYKSNWELSVARALAVLHYLADVKGFPAERLMVAGCADTQPVAPNATPEGRRKNRRAELIVRPGDLQVAAR